MSFRAVFNSRDSEAKSSFPFFFVINTKEKNCLTFFFFEFKENLFVCLNSDRRLALKLHLK